MIDLWELALSNSLGAALLGLAAGIATWLRRSPQIAHALWLLALLKLVAPPLAVFQVALFPAAPESETESLVAARQASDLPGELQGVPIETYLDEIETLLESTPATSPPDAAATAGVPPLPANDSSQAREELSDLELAQQVPPLVEPTQANVHLAVSWRTGLIIAWACGSCVYLVLVALHTLRFLKFLRGRCRVDAEYEAIAARLAASMGLRRPPKVRVVEARVSPLVWWAGRRPIVLLPGDLMASFNAAQRESVIAHELAHVRRGDHFVRWLELVVCTACWWNPLAWFARAQLRVAEEACCDAWVVWALPGERRNYGRAMLAANEFLTAAAPLPGLAGSALGGASCKRRIEMVMQQDVPRRMSRSAFAMVAVLALAALPLAAQTSSSATSSNDSNGEIVGVGVSSDAVVVGSTSASASDDSQVAGAGASGTEYTVQADDRASADEYTVQSDDRASGDEYTLQADENGVVVRTPDSVLRARSLTLRGGERQAEDAGDAESEDTSNQALMARVERLEKLLERFLSAQTSEGQAAQSQTIGSLQNDATGAPSAGVEFQTTPDLPVVRPDAGASPDLEERLLTLDVEQAVLNMEKVKTELGRQEELKRRNVISETEIEQFRYDLRLAEIEVARAETKLELFRMRRAAGLPRTSAFSPFQQRTSSASQSRSTGGAIQSH